MNTHTPGPWEVVTDKRKGREGRLSIRRMNTCECVVYQVDPGSLFHMDTHQADANLIAASPELLDVLEDLLSYHIEATKTTDTYCDACETHAHKHEDSLGNWTGKITPIIHTVWCPIGRAEATIKKAKIGSEPIAGVESAGPREEEVKS